LHPERYLAREKPVLPDLPDRNLDTGREITEGSLGEFDHRMLIWQYLGAAAADKLAPHLRGAQFRVTADEKGKHPVLAYVSLWDSRKSAREYFAAYKKILNGKWKRCAPSEDTDTAFSGSGDNGYFLVHLRGEQITSIEGMSAPAALASIRNTAVHKTPARVPAKLN
jgi:hypothetical protein